MSIDDSIDKQSDKGNEVPKTEKLSPAKIKEILSVSKDDDFRESTATFLNTFDLLELLKQKNIPKYEHTIKALRLLDTTNLDGSEKFLARASLMLHDIDLPEVAGEVVKWIEAGVISRDEATRLLKHVWWHDFLGKVGERIYTDINDIYSIFPEEQDRAIHCVIHLADVSSYPAFQYVLPEVRERITSLKSTPALFTQDISLNYQQVKDRGIAPKGIEEPKEGQMFIHTLPAKDNSEAFILANILCGDGVIKSTGLLNKSERIRGGQSLGKIIGGGEHGFEREINTSLATAEQVNVYNESNVALVFSGAAIKECGAAVTFAGGYPGIVSKFSAEGAVLGGEIPLTHAMIALNFDMGSDKLTQILHLLEAVAETRSDNPLQWLQNNVFFYEDQVDFQEIIRGLIEKRIDIKDRNEELLEKVILEEIEHIPDEPLVRVYGEKDSSEIVPISKLNPGKDEEQQIIYGTIKSMDSAKLVEKMEALAFVYPEVTGKSLSELRLKYGAIENQLNNLKQKIKINGGLWYDPQLKLSYFDNYDNIYVFPTDEEPTKIDEKDRIWSHDPKWSFIQNGENYNLVEVIGDVSFKRSDI